MVDNESDIAAFKDFQPDDAPLSPTPVPEAQAPPPSQPPPPTAQPTQPPPPSQPVPSEGRVVASPYAKNLANQQGINLQVCNAS